MIKEVKGDILLSDAALLVHSVAPMDHFDTGLALSLRDQYPEMVKEFRHHCRVHHPSPGEIFNWIGTDGKHIVSLMAQEPPPSAHGHANPGKASISNLEHALKKLAKLIEHDEVKSVALPKLATGVGGLKWEEVQSSIHKYLGQLEVPVYLYTTYVKGVKASEG